MFCDPCVTDLKEFHSHENQVLEDCSEQGLDSDTGESRVFMLSNFCSVEYTFFYGLPIQ